MINKTLSRQASFGNSALVKIFRENGTPKRQQAIMQVQTAGAREAEREEWSVAKEGGAEAAKANGSKR